MRGQEPWPVVLRGSLSLAPQDDGMRTTVEFFKKPHNF